MLTFRSYGNIRLAACHRTTERNLCVYQATARHVSRESGSTRPRESDLPRLERASVQPRRPRRMRTRSPYVGCVAWTFQSLINASDAHLSSPEVELLRREARPLPRCLAQSPSGHLLCEQRECRKGPCRPRPCLCETRWERKAFPFSSFTYHSVTQLTNSIGATGIILVHGSMADGELSAEQAGRPFIFSRNDCIAYGAGVAGGHLRRGLF